jgi:dihydroorotate dehydrogenase electron transfer subunit
MESPNMIKITRVIDEAEEIKTLMFNYRFKETPIGGQFIMTWLPGVDEIPLALSYIASKKQQEYGVTVASVGPATEQFHMFKIGDTMGIRGPYGNGFSLGKAKSILIVGGGIGMAPLAPAVEAARRSRMKIHVAIGAKTAAGLLFADRISGEGLKPEICTDNGSAGKKALVTEIAEEMIEHNKYDLVLGCGPEPMLVKLVNLCNSKNIEVQVSLERYMKCGVGVCDSCAINGFHVCKDGPVFDGELLEKIEDFGKFKRDPTGRRIKL